MGRLIQIDWIFIFTRSRFPKQNWNKVRIFWKWHCLVDVLEIDVNQPIQLIQIIRLVWLSTELILFNKNAKAAFVIRKCFMSSTRCGVLLITDDEKLHLRITVKCLAVYHIIKHRTLPYLRQCYWIRIVYSVALSATNYHNNNIYSQFAMLFNSSLFCIQHFTFIDQIGRSSEDSVWRLETNNAIITGSNAET